MDLSRCHTPITDTLSNQELDELATKYEGFYRFTKLMKQLEQAIAIDCSEVITTIDDSISSDDYD